MVLLVLQCEDRNPAGLKGIASSVVEMMTCSFPCGLRERAVAQKLLMKLTADYGNP